MLNDLIFFYRDVASIWKGMHLLQERAHNGLKSAQNYFSEMLTKQELPGNRMMWHHCIPIAVWVGETSLELAPNLAETFLSDTECCTVNSLASVSSPKCEGPLWI